MRFSIEYIRRTIFTFSNDSLIASIANLLRHLEETNEKHYNHDILKQKNVESLISQVFHTLSRIARGGFGLRSASVGAKPRSPGPRAPSTLRPSVSGSKFILDIKKEEPI